MFRRLIAWFFGVIIFLFVTIASYSFFADLGSSEISTDDGSYSIGGFDAFFLALLVTTPFLAATLIWQIIGRKPALVVYAIGAPLITFLGVKTFHGLAYGFWIVSLSETDLMSFAALALGGASMAIVSSIIGK